MTGWKRFPPHRTNADRRGAGRPGVAEGELRGGAFDKSVTELLGDSLEQIERSALEIVVLDLYRRHEISVDRAAEILGLDLLLFIRWSGARGVPYFDLDEDDWEQELRGINKN